MASTLCSAPNTGDLGTWKSFSAQVVLEARQRAEDLSQDRVSALNGAIDAVLKNFATLDSATVRIAALIHITNQCYRRWEGAIWSRRCEIFFHKLLGAVPETPASSSQQERLLALQTLGAVSVLSPQHRERTHKTLNFCAQNDPDPVIFLRAYNMLRIFEMQEIWKIVDRIHLRYPSRFAEIQDQYQNSSRDLPMTVTALQVEAELLPEDFRLRPVLLTALDRMNKIIFR